MNRRDAYRRMVREDTGLAGKTAYPGVTWIGDGGKSDKIRDNAIVTRRFLTDEPLRENEYAVDRDGSGQRPEWALGGEFPTVADAVHAFRVGAPNKDVMEAYLELVRSGEFDSLPRVRGLRRRVVADDMSGDVVNMGRVWTMDRPWDRMQRTGGTPRLTIGLGIGGHAGEESAHFTRQIALAVAAADRLLAAGYDIRIVGLWTGIWVGESRSNYALQFMIKDFGAPLDPGLALASGMRSTFRCVILPKVPDIFQFVHAGNGAPQVLGPAMLKAECGVDLSIATYGGRNTVEYISAQLKTIDEANHAFC